MSQPQEPLTYQDPRGMEGRRMVVAGSSGAGKTTFARAIAARLALPYTEMDALFHGPGWTPRPTFRSEVDAFTSQPAWVTEWQYTEVRPLLAARADTLIWLDYSRSLVMRRVVGRTLRRWALREELWNGNREPNLWHAFTHPEEGIVRWAWTTHHLTAERVTSLLESGGGPTVVRLRNPREASMWLDQRALRAARRLEG